MLRRGSPEHDSSSCAGCVGSPLVVGQIRRSDSGSRVNRITTDVPSECWSGRKQFTRTLSVRSNPGFYIYSSIAELQSDLDVWFRSYHEERPHQGRWCYGKTPMQTFRDAIPLAQEKMIAA